MTTDADPSSSSVIDYCATIGTNPLLIQGAGGNVSWKDGATLWIKASGTWLADAGSIPIFVPVDLVHLQHAIARRDFSVIPHVLGDALLRPSIETLLHALLPHRVVIHLHAIEILAWLVRADCLAGLRSRLDESLHWTLVEFQVPGAPLAAAVSAVLDDMPSTSVVFLESHGVVIGAANVIEIDNILRALVDVLAVTPRQKTSTPPPIHGIKIRRGAEYVPFADLTVHQLATDRALFTRLAVDWALYPDHVVFLGGQPHVYADLTAALASLHGQSEMPDLIFVGGLGVFVKPDFSLAKQLQVRCYYDVLSRQDEDVLLKSLETEEISQLLNWDAEKYRMQLSK